MILNTNNNINSLIRAVLTTWWALRTPQRRGPTGKLDAEEEERGGELCRPPQPNGGSGERFIRSSAGKYTTDGKDFGNL